MAKHDQKPGKSRRKYPSDYKPHLTKEGESFPQDIDWKIWQEIANISKDELKEALDELVAKQIISRDDRDDHRWELMLFCYKAYQNFQANRNPEKESEFAKRNFLRGVIRNAKRYIVRKRNFQKRAGEFKTISLEPDAPVADLARNVEEVEFYLTYKVLKRLCPRMERLALVLLFEENWKEDWVAKKFKMTHYRFHRDIIFVLQDITNRCYEIFPAEVLKAEQQAWINQRG